MVFMFLVSTMTDLLLILGNYKIVLITASRSSPLNSTEHDTTQTYHCLPGKERQIVKGELHCSFHPISTDAWLAKVIVKSLCIPMAKAELSLSRLYLDKQTNFLSLIIRSEIWPINWPNTINNFKNGDNKAHKNKTIKAKLHKMPFINFLCTV